MTNNKQQTAVEWFIEELEYKGDLRETPSIRNIQLNIDTSDYMELKVQAQEMEKAKHEKFNKFLNDEKQLGISDLKIVERIQWYYNTYFNETYGSNETIQ